ncbi:MAG TPA: hypothetical protein PLO35_08785 [Candidatus Cloacimonadota bacterium]|nr:hypothetical protein [Candidatus Cloacimonadota bacterium]
MKTILALFGLFFLCTALPAATWNVILIDSYGNGWNGATLTVMVNGTAVLNNITLASGSEQSYTLAIFHGDKITTTYVAGIYPGEPEYSFANEVGVMVLSNGAGPTVVPTSITDPFMAAVLTPDLYQIGAGTLTGFLPIIPYFGYSYSQSIYRRSDLPRTWKATA